MAGGVPAMCDGITQGQLGMELSLFSRDTIAKATAIALSHQMFDGAIMLGGLRQNSARRSSLAHCNLGICPQYLFRPAQCLQVSRIVKKSPLEKNTQQDL